MAEVVNAYTYHNYPFLGDDYAALEQLITTKYNSSWPEIAAYATQAGYDVDKIDDLCMLAGVERERNAAGKVISYKIPTNVQKTTASAVNSNVGTIQRATVQGVATTGTTSAGKVTTGVLRGAGTKVVTAASKVAVPLTVASVGITLGKTIDETLYNLNPNFWNELGLETLNPDTWAKCIIPDSELGQDVFNLIFGIDPSTGEAQAYMDAEALAYTAYAMWQNDVWANGQTIADMPDDPDFDDGEAWSLPLVVCDPTEYNLNWTSINPSINSTVEVRTSSDTVYCIPYQYTYNGTQQNLCFLCSKQSFTARSVQSNGPYYTNLTVRSGSYNGQPVYWCQTAALGGDNLMIPTPSGITYLPANNAKLCYVPLYGTVETSTPIEGLGNQTGATMPDFTGLGENDILPYLQTRYPDMFSNAISYPVLQDDGTIDTHTYVPITMAQGNGWPDTQPISGGQTQAQPSINPETSPIPIIDILTQLLQQPQPETETDPYGNPVPPDNPTDTGDGSSPTPVPVTGEASSLWAIYHPTKAQIDSFGAWLWSSNFVDQILKVFNNPMEAIIGLHQIYVTPTDAGTRNIKVGYLDSGVSSAYVEQQYTYVSCGSVNLNEQFGNVFDYAPFTDVQLYLPFIGIVPLNVEDVMRSTISIEYGVDVFTGACLAMVEITRDANSSVMYQYSGNCAVTYPISSGSYMGIVSGIVSIAGGIAATAATGGSAAPIALGAANAAMNSHTKVQHSGSFSGNAGAMGGKIPYLIISRPQTRMTNYQSMQGMTTNEFVTVGDCEGYIKAKSAHIVNVNATDEEMNLINDLLLSGIII